MEKNIQPYPNQIDNNVKDNKGVNNSKKINLNKPPDPPIEKLYFNKDYLDAIDDLNEELKQYIPNKGRDFQSGDNLAECWKCHTLNLVHPSWEMIECAYCHTLCNLTGKNSRTPETTKKKKFTSHCVFTELICPKCKKENKCLASRKTMVCICCRNEFEIIHPDENPPEIDLNSMDPNSRYYKFKNGPQPAEYPPKGVYPINDLFFPDPQLVNWFPMNPYGNYSLPYQEARSFERTRKALEFQNRIRKEYLGKNQLKENQKKLYIDKLKELDQKMTKAIQKGYSNGYYYDPSKLGNNNKKENDYLSRRNKDKLKYYEEMLMLNPNSPLIKK